MAKNIVICSDGTWNSAYKRRGTNVFKLFEAVDTSDDEQIAFYDDGVGTEKLRILRLLGGACRMGILRRFSISLDAPSLQVSPQASQPARSWGNIPGFSGPLNDIRKRTTGRAYHLIGDAAVTIPYH